MHTHTCTQNRTDSWTYNILYVTHTLCICNYVYIYTYWYYHKHVVYQNVCEYHMISYRITSQPVAITSSSDSLLSRSGVIHQQWQDPADTPRGQEGLQIWSWTMPGQPYPLWLKRIWCDKMCFLFGSSWGFDVNHPRLHVSFTHTCTPYL